MKLSIAAAAAVFMLFSPAFAQSGDVNGATLGQSQPGVNAGVPYPNRAAPYDPAPEATERTAPVENDGGKVQGAAAPKRHKNASKKSASSKKSAETSAKKTAAAKDQVTPTNPPSPGASTPH
jgi:hypothetical protein